MSIIYILIPLAAIITGLAIYLFFWAVKSDQFDDLEKQGLSILFDEQSPAKKSVSKESTPNNKKTDITSKASSAAKPTLNEHTKNKSNRVTKRHDT